MAATTEPTGQEKAASATAKPEFSTAQKSDISETHKGASAKKIPDSSGTRKFTHLPNKKDEGDVPYAGDGATTWIECSECHGAVCYDPNHLDVFYCPNCQLPYMG